MPLRCPRSRVAPPAGALRSSLAPSVGALRRHGTPLLGALRSRIAPPAGPVAPPASATGYRTAPRSRTASPANTRFHAPARLALPLLLAAALGLIAGCGQAADPTAPPEIRYGVDVSVSCGMIISDVGYASAYRTADGEVRLFDEPGEMALYHREHQEAVAAFFVHDRTSGKWLRAEDAYYVFSRALRTPMGVGVAALATEADAQALAERTQGRVYTFNELIAHADLPGAATH